MKQTAQIFSEGESPTLISTSFRKNKIGNRQTM